MSKFIKRFSSFLLIFLFLGVFSSAFSRVVFAAGGTAQCVGEGVAKYSQGVLDGVNSPLTHVKLLSPAFNFSHPLFPEMFGYFNEGGLASSFHAVAGNAYYHTNANLTISDQIASVNASKVLLTETGWYPDNGSNDIYNTVKEDLKTYLGGKLEGALFFNIFNNNSDFSHHALDDPGEIRNKLCGGDCSKLGANSASYYSSSVEAFYKKAKDAKMGYTLEIATSPSIDRGLLDGIERAHARGMIPIVRIGVGDNSGNFDDPSALATFINQLDSAVTGTVYVIAGPNEPLLECWATPNCTGCGNTVISDFGPRQIIGKVTTARPIIDTSTGSTITGADVEGVTICAYHGRRNYGTDPKAVLPTTLGAGIGSFYGSAVTDKNGFFRIENAEYIDDPYVHFSTDEIPESDILVAYTGDTFQNAIIVPIAPTIEDLISFDVYPEPVYYSYKNLFESLAEFESLTDTLLLPVDFEVAVDTNEVSPATFDEPATDPRCPAEAIYLNREVSARTNCQGGLNVSDAASGPQDLIAAVGHKEAQPDKTKNIVETEWIDKQHIGKKSKDWFSWLQRDHGDLEEINEAELYREYKGKDDMGNEKWEGMEGRAATRNFAEALEEYRMAFCKVYGACEYMDGAPHTGELHMQAEVPYCENLIEMNKPKGKFGTNSTRMGFGINLASKPIYGELGDGVGRMNSMATIYQMMMGYHLLTEADEIVENDYDPPMCINNESIVTMSQVEPPDSFKSPEDWKKTYEYSNEYFNYATIFKREGILFEQNTEVTNDSYTPINTNATLDVKTYVTKTNDAIGPNGEIMYDSSNPHLIPENLNSYYEDTGIRVTEPDVDSQSTAFRNRVQTEEPKDSLSSVSAGMGTAPFYFTGLGGEGAKNNKEPEVNFIMTKIDKDDVNMIQITEPNISGNMKNFAYATTRYTIGAPNLLCTYADTDADKLHPITNGAREVFKVFKTENNPAGGDVALGGWFENFWKVQQEDAGGQVELEKQFYGLSGQRLNLLTRTGGAGFLHNIIRDIWSWFKVNESNYEKDNTCIQYEIKKIPDLFGLGKKICDLYPEKAKCHCVEIETCYTIDEVTRKKTSVNCNNCGDGCIRDTKTECTVRKYTINGQTGEMEDGYGCTGIIEETTTEMETQSKLVNKNVLTGMNAFTQMLAPPNETTPRTLQKKTLLMDGYTTQTKPGHEYEGEGGVQEYGDKSDIQLLDQLIRPFQIETMEL